ncbi:Txe/YoeB family addiction module toxin [Paenarthrobacter sp. Z7-10]|uniref:Txe/YoeB family addiction module toxin n=1 Tax=Paenarthrobacter sp. Z7-10 TaxID=2787635 RepID=UPI0022A97D62|nr:Txe/YoeB family addiction module toxin [Paenarthrobacter sp. Z7-10]MCZ2402547.1 Txe/YoeB family addiction module toxin [Paenarthrobacter sp. Z7-10]
MNILFTYRAGEDYMYWTGTDKAMVRRISLLIKDCQRDAFAGIGKPEALKHQLSGYCSRRITDEHRLVYTVEPGRLVIIAARHHY